MGTMRGDGSLRGELDWRATPIEPNRPAIEASGPAPVAASSEREGVSAAEQLIFLREEQARLRRRQDDLEHELLQRMSGKGKDADPEASDKSEGRSGKGEKEDGKKDDSKPSLRERLQRGFREHPIRSAAVGVGIVAALLGGVFFYLHTLTYEDTDDAEIDGDISSISPRITGTVTGVYVVDNQVVHAGDLIAELDVHDYDVAVAQAKAAVAQAQAQLKAEQPQVPITAVTNKTTISTSGTDVANAGAELAGAQRDLEQARAQIAEAEAKDRYAQMERQRMVRLAAVGAVARTQADEKSSAADATAATVEAARQAAMAAEKRVDQQRAKLSATQTRLDEARTNAPQQLEAKQASVDLRQAALAAAQAELEQAELNRSYARIVAPVDGVIGKKTVNIGDRVQPGQQMAALTQTGHLWVTANFRETQLREMHPDQRVAVHVDALGLDFTGKVESLPGATGSRYSILPPENATGNYVKVVQRLPVRIRLDDGQSGYERLRPGMSVEPKVTLK